MTIESAFEARADVFVDPVTAQGYGAQTFHFGVTNKFEATAIRQAKIADQEIKITFREPASSFRQAIGGSNLMASAQEQPFENLGGRAVILHQESTWHYVGLFTASALWLYYAAYMYRARKRQQRRVEVFDSSLRGDLDRALSQNEFQMAMTRDNAWRGLAPVWVAATLWIVVIFHLKGAVFWGYLLMVAISIGSLAAVLWRKHRVIRKRLVPRQQELESLRAKLADTGR